MERQQRGEQGCHEQELGDACQRGPAHPEHQSRPLGRGVGDDVRLPRVGGHGPGRSRVDDGDDGQREVGGGRDGAPGVAGFLGQDRGLLEADVAQAGDDGQHAERAPAR